MKETIQIFDMVNETSYPVVTYTDFDKQGRVQILIKAPNRSFADLAFAKLEGNKKHTVKVVNYNYYYTITG